jgi:hypothetical protein
MNIRYLALCVEAGEHFYSTFISKETDPCKLKQEGMELASQWGAECLSVKKDSNQEITEDDS